MRFTRRTLEKHASGCLRQYTVSWVGRRGRLRSIRLSVGGYGNIPAPAGQWTILPRIRYYRAVLRVYLHWFNVSLSFSPNSYGIDYWIDPDSLLSRSKPSREKS